MLAQFNRESTAQFENRTKPRVYVRYITRSTLYEKLHFASRNWRKENKFCSMWIHYWNPFFWLPEKFNQQNKWSLWSGVELDRIDSDILLKKHKLHFNRLFCCNHTCYCVGMFLCYVTSAPRYESRSSMSLEVWFHGIPRNWLSQFRL